MDTEQQWHIHKHIAITLLMNFCNIFHDRQVPIWQCRFRFPLYKRNSLNNTKPTVIIMDQLRKKFISSIDAHSMDICSWHDQLPHRVNILLYTTVNIDHRSPFSSSILVLVRLGLLVGGHVFYFRLQMPLEE